MDGDYTASRGVGAHKQCKGAGLYPCSDFTTVGIGMVQEAAASVARRVGEYLDLLVDEDPV